jgi:hypothetical protein
MIEFRNKLFVFALVLTVAAFAASVWHDYQETERARLLILERERAAMFNLIKRACVGEE